MIRFLLAKGAKINKRSYGPDYPTPLSLFCESEYSVHRSGLEVPKPLLDHGADINFALHGGSSLVEMDFLITCR